MLLLIAILAQSPLTDLRELPSPSAPGAGQHNLAVGSDGRVYLSWIDALPDTSHVLRFAVLGGGSWSQPRTIASGRDWFVNWADFPSLVAGERGMLAVHWLQKSGLGRYSYDVRLARSSDGGVTWGPSVVPHRDGTPTEHGFASLWPEQDGIGAVWVDGRKTADSNRARHEMALRYASWPAGGDPGPEVEVDPRICECCQTAAALTADGPVVVYRNRTSDEVRDIAIVRRVNGVWTEPRLVAADNWTINACPVNGPAVAADGRRVAVAWYTGAGNQRRVKAAFSADGGATFGEPLVIDDGRPAGRVGIIMLENGDALVSWLEDTAAGAEVRVRRARPEGDLGSAMAIARTTSARPSGFPRMVRSGNRVVFAWRDPETAAGAGVRTAVARLR